MSCDKKMFPKAELIGALVEALENDCVKNVRVLLLSHQDQITANDVLFHEKKTKALHVACSPEMIRLLVQEFGADVNAVTNDGSTPLIYCCMAGDQKVDCVRELCALGCDPMILDDDGDGPLYYANGCTPPAVACISVLREFGVKGKPSDPNHTSSGRIHFTKEANFPPGLGSKSGQRCYSCNEFGINGKKLSRCSRCRNAWYCSRKCQAKDWQEFHQDQCFKVAKSL